MNIYIPIEVLCCFFTSFGYGLHLISDTDMPKRNDSGNTNSKLASVSERLKSIDATGIMVVLLDSSLYLRQNRR